MSIQMIPFVLGPLENNTYLLFDDQSRDAVVIDPSFGSDAVLEEIRSRGLTLKAIWATHAHFDHIGGVNTLVRATEPAPQIALHQADLALWRQGGGSASFGIRMEKQAEPNLWIEQSTMLTLGSESVEVRFTPGHTRGHVIFYVPALRSAFVGDLIFYRGVGRTDLPGGDFDTLAGSINSQIFTLPPETVLYPGHGPETTVAEEQAENPFLN